MKTPAKSPTLLYLHNSKTTGVRTRKSRGARQTPDGAGPAGGPEAAGAWDGAGLAKREAPRQRCVAAQGVPDAELNTCHLLL